MTPVKSLGIKIYLGTFLSVNLILVSWSGCASIPAQYKPFLELPEGKQRVEMRSYPIDRQVELYLAAMRYVHPPPIGLAEEVAKGGKEKLPAILNLLKEEKDTNNQENIIYVLEVMHGCCYDLHNEKEVIGYLQETLSNAKDENLKSRSDEALRYIVHGEMPDVIKLLNSTKEELRKH
jgi:hypothetical protein